MKAFLGRSFIYVLYFIFFNIFYIGIIAYTDWDCRKRLESLKLDNPEFELLVLGSSLAMDAIDCELLTSCGIRSYNTALGGASIKTNYIQLNEYLTKSSQKPKYVILGLGTFGETFFNERIHPLVEVTMKDYKYGVNDLPILKFKWLGVEFLKKIVSSKHRKAKIVCGQLKFQKIVPDNTEYNDSYLNIEQYRSSQWIGEIAKLCHQNRIELLILELPGFKRTQNLSGVGPYLLSFNNGYSANLYNFNYKNFCEIFDADQDWIGNSHLNEFGAKKFSKELFKILNINHE
ncbi:MAG: hypothetical protein MUO72_09940 [Bacteroidales bacterium]|nr:hypothetical protein [Bacteroidales bacterium]